jgi:hypothetical protein
MKDDLDLVWLAALGVIAWILWDHFGRGPARVLPLPNNAKIRQGIFQLTRPTPPPAAGADEGGGFIDGAVQTYDAIAAKYGYDTCKSYGGSDAVCKFGAEALKYANPVTVTVHVAGEAADWAGEHLNPFNW